MKHMDTRCIQLKDTAEDTTQDAEQGHGKYFF